MRYAYGFLGIIVLIVAGVYLWLNRPAVIHMSEGDLPTYPGLVFFEKKPDKDFLHLYYCPREECSLQELVALPVPESYVGTWYEASEVHHPPIPRAKEWERQQSFRQFYEGLLEARNYRHENVVIEGKGYFEFFEAEKQSQIVSYMGRLRGDTIELAVVKTITDDSSDCPDSQKSIFDTCGVNAGERFSVYLSKPIPVSELLPR